MKLETFVLMLLVANSSLLHVNYVRPSNSLPEVCPDYPCFTLDQYAQQGNTSFSTEARVFFLSGSHTLRSPLIIGDVTDVKLRGQNATIFYDGSGVIKCVNAASFSIEGLTFILNSTNIGLIISGVRNATIINSTFQGDTTISHLAKAVSITECNATIKKSRFIGNEIVDAEGAVLSVMQSAIEIVESIFERNTGFYGGAIAVFNGSIALSGNLFTRNEATCGAAVFATQSTITLREELGNSFMHNSASHSGGALCIHNSVLKMDKSECVISDSENELLVQPCNHYFHNNTARRSGGAISFTFSQVILNGTNATFANNSGQSAGAISIGNSAVVLSLANLNCINNEALTLGGGISAFDSILTLGNSRNNFAYNTATISGGAIFVGAGSLWVSGKSRFSNNIARQGQGGAVSVGDSHLRMSGSVVFLYNFAVVGGAMNLESNSIFNGTADISFLDNSALLVGGGISCDASKLHAENLLLYKNSAGGGAGLYLLNCTSQLSNSNFTLNTGHNFGGAVGAIKSNVEISSSTIAENLHGIYAENSELALERAEFNRNHGNSAGGGILAFRSTVSLRSAKFDGNQAPSGGAIHGLYTQLFASGHVVFMNNNARDFGGAISAVNVDITLNNTVIFRTNSAGNVGGALYINSASTLTLQPHTSIRTSHNHAFAQGGAIYHEDAADKFQCGFESTAQSSNFELNEMRLGQIYASSGFLSKCFIALNEADTSNVSASFSSYNDTAGIDGSFLYGGLLDKCHMEIIVNSLTVGEFVHTIVPYTFLTNNVIHVRPMSAGNSTNNAISSEPYKLCFCDSNHSFNCSAVKSFQLLRGQPFSVSVLAINQGNTTVSSQVTAIVSSSARLKLGQASQMIGHHCTTLTYNMYSKERNELLILYSDGPCRDVGLARAVVDLTFASCPEGFTQSGGECICEGRLQAYDAECVIDQKVYVKRKAGTDFWISALYENESYAGVIIYKTCPKDYCTKNNVNLNFDNIDAQCEENRGGLLCGACTANYSLLLGTARCQTCSNVYLVLLVPFAAAGIALVVFLSFLRLTVATGMINSVLLFANIIQANKNAIFPSTSGNVLTVFIAWLNLDLGFQTCFYNGMDAYAQTWLQFAFPLYIWILISLIIIASRYSITISKLIGHNPIAVLATLLLMSYAKVLKIIIEVYSSVDLDYPDNKTVTVWLKDANVPYLHSKHFALTVTTTLFLILFFLPYTLLVLLGHKLYCFSGKKYFGWLRRVKPLLDSYYAPYKLKTRCWTGFLLIVRCVLYIVFSFNSLGGARKSLVAINITFTAVVIIAWLVVRIYENFYINVIEASIYLNLIAISAASLAGVDGPELVYSLVGIVFAIQLGIIVSQFYILYIAKSLLWVNFKSKLQGGVGRYTTKRTAQQTAPMAAISSQDPHRIVTKTVIDMREPMLELELDKNN